MAKDLTEALDKCLAAIAQGAPPEECLARYPQWAEELRALLEVATELRRVPRLLPNAARQDADYRRFMQKAAALRPRKAASVKQPRSGLSLTARLGALAASLLLIVMLLGGSTIALAWNSQPDSPLYPVKLAAERANLWFAFGDEREASLLLDQSERRLAEMRQLMAQDKAVSPKVLAELVWRTRRAYNIITQKRVSPELRTRAQDLWSRQEELLLGLRDRVASNANNHFAAALVAIHNGRLALYGRPSPLPVTPRQVVEGLTQISGIIHQERPGVLTVGGWQIAVDERTIIGGDAEEIEGRSGLVTAVRDDAGRLWGLVIVLDSASRNEDIRLRGTLERVDERQWRVADRIFSVDKETVAQGQLRPGALVEILGSGADNQELRVAVVRTLAPQIFIYEGVYGGARQEGKTASWIIGGQAIYIKPFTLMDARAAPVARGALLRVEGMVQDGQPVAVRVRALLAPGEGNTVRLEGGLSGVNGNNWSVGGLPVNVKDADRPSTPPRPGTWLQVEGTWAGRVLAARSVSLGPSIDQQVVVEGTVEEVRQDALKVAGTVLRLSPETIMRGNLNRGGHASVHAVKAADGSLQAVQVEAWSAPSPTERTPNPKR